MLHTTQKTSLMLLRQNIADRLKEHKQVLKSGYLAQTAAGEHAAQELHDTDRKCTMGDGCQDNAENVVRLV